MGKQRTIRLPRPKPVGKPTLHARGASFAQLTTGLGTGFKVASTIDTTPFTGPTAALWAHKTGDLDAGAKACVAAAIRLPDIVRGTATSAGITHSTGTIPELVLAGLYLLRGYRLHRNLFFQEKALYGFRLTKPYVADVAVLGPGGTLWLLPIDGLFFHNRTLAQQIVTRQQHAALAAVGRVVAVPDTECKSRVRLEGFLRRNGAP
jgi:hypothetical protein